MITKVIDATIRPMVNTWRYDPADALMYTIFGTLILVIGLSILGLILWGAFSLGLFWGSLLILGIPTVIVSGFFLGKKIYDE